MNIDGSKKVKIVAMDIQTNRSTMNAKKTCNFGKVYGQKCWRFRKVTFSTSIVPPYRIMASYRQNCQ
jgi:hypothetical protein